MMPEEDRATFERELERDEAEEYLPYDGDRHEPEDRSCEF